MSELRVTREHVAILRHAMRSVSPDNLPRYEAVLHDLVETLKEREAGEADEELQRCGTPTWKYNRAAAGNWEHVPCGAPLPCGTHLERGAFESKQLAFLRHLVDVVWSEAHEDESVPSTEWADRLIARARARAAGQ